MKSILHKLCLFVSLPFSQCVVSALIMIAHLPIYTYKNLRLILKYINLNSFPGKDLEKK